MRLVWIALLIPFAVATAQEAEALRIHQPPGEHSFTVEAFEAMASFFDEFLRS